MKTVYVVQFLQSGYMPQSSHHWIDVYDEEFATEQEALTKVSETNAAFDRSADMSLHASYTGPKEKP